MLFKSGWTLLTGRIVPLVALAVFVSPVLAQNTDPCFDKCHAEAMEIYDGPWDPDDEDWQDANDHLFECMDGC